MKSRYSPRLGREVYLLFTGTPRTLSDTLCTCHGGLRPIGGCAHAIAVLLLLGQLTNRFVPADPTRSEEILKRALWYFQHSDSESESESASEITSTGESGSESSSDGDESGSDEPDSEGSESSGPERLRKTSASSVEY